MATTRLAREQWQPYFDRVSRSLSGRQAEIEVVGLGIGDQVEKEWTALNGLAYDSRDDVFEVLTEDVDHLVPHPKDIYVDYDADGLHSVEVIDAEENHQLIKLREPLALPAAK